MNEIEAQTNDRKQTEYELEMVFDKLEDGTPITTADIDLLRWATGLRPIERNVQLKNLFNEFASIFGEKKC